MSCEFGHHDGAFVLGALSAGERSAYQAHLPTCADCSRATLELAGLPGLLARVPEDVFRSPSDESPPETLLPALARKAQRIQRRRSWLAIGAAAAAAVAVAAGSLAIRQAIDDHDAPTALPSVTSPNPIGQAMVPIGSRVMSANVALTTVGWGTRVNLTCDYPSSSYGSEAPGVARYAMFVRTRDGQVERVASWRAQPGRTMHLVAGTAMSREDISSVEIRTAIGKPVLRSIS